MQGEDHAGLTPVAAAAGPPLVDGEVMLQAGVLGLTYLVPVVVLRAALRLAQGLRRRAGVGRPRLVAAVIELKGRG